MGMGQHGAAYMRSEEKGDVLFLLFISENGFHAKSPGKRNCATFADLFMREKGSSIQIPGKMKL